MNFAEGQLKETLKILAFQFVDSVEKMYFLYRKQLHPHKEQIFQKILQAIEVEKKPIQVVDDCVKILQNSYEEKLKKECFEKDFSISVQNNSVSKQSHIFDESDCFDHAKSNSLDHPKDPFDLSNQKLKKDISNRHQAYQITQYNRQPQQNFFVIENLVNRIKYEDIKGQNQLDKEEYQNNSESQQCSEDSDYQNQSSNKNIFQTPNLKIRTKKFKFNKKKYRSYTEDQRQEAVESARQYGVDAASRLLAIPKKNITRWMKRKVRQQKIRGRKPGNPDMEDNLTKWLTQNIKRGNYLTQTEIRIKAKLFSRDTNFKASKGWLEKYFRRNRSISNGINALLTEKRIKTLNVKKEEVNVFKQQAI